MITIAGALLGGIWGAVLAKRRGGNRLDIAQYAGVLAMIGGVLGLFITIFIARSMV